LTLLHNKVTAVTNLAADDGRGRAFVLDAASTTSAFNPTTKQIKVEYFMKQNGRPDCGFRPSLNTLVRDLNLFDIKI
jgi:hypothetical protein